MSELEKNLGAQGSNDTAPRHGSLPLSALTQPVRAGRQGAGQEGWSPQTSGLQDMAPYYPLSPDSSGAPETRLNLKSLYFLDDGSMFS